MKLSIGFSPCPNDCFIFDAMVHQKIDTIGLKFVPVMLDVEALNQKAFRNELDITKLSFHAFLYAQENYVLLRSGSALGFNCGPLLVARKNSELRPESFRDPNSELTAIPGKFTTANFLLSLAFPEVKNKVEMLFSDIEQAVLDGKAEAGLIIHEGRFTYESKGLKKIMDLGEYWESLIHAPIPLGGIVAKRTLDPEITRKINDCIKRSVEFAFKNPESSMAYVREHAQEMDEAVMKKHIELYVNEFSIDLGETGTKAVNLLFDKAKEKGLIDKITEPLIFK